MPTIPSNSPTGTTGHKGPDEGRPVVGAFAASDIVRVALQDVEEGRILEFEQMGPAVVTDGYGGWTSRGRPGRRGIVQYNGVETIALKVPGMFDGWADEESVEDDCRLLEIFGGGLVAQDPKPPKLRVHGLLVPHAASAASQNRWVINGLEWDESDEGHIRRSWPDGDRIRQMFSLVLVLATTPDELSKIKPAPAKPAYKVAIAKKDDTYKKIAARRLRDAALGLKLAKLNKHSNPNMKLKEGAKVRLPSSHLLELWRRELKQKKR